MYGLFSLGNRFLNRGATQPMRPSGPQAWGGRRDPYWNYETGTANTQRQAMKNIAMSMLAPRKFGSGSNR